MESKRGVLTWSERTQKFPDEERFALKSEEGLGIRKWALQEQKQQGEKK